MIHDNVQRQLDYMGYFNEDVGVAINETKLLQAPMTNDGCESELATCGESITAQQFHLEHSQIVMW